MKWIRKYKKLFLSTGLGMLAAAFIAYRLGAPGCYSGALLGVAILLKMLFLTAVFSTKGFRPGLWLYFILAGVALILISLLFKTVFPVRILYQILFYSAISLKMTGLVLMFFSQKE
ncbi:MAG: hypothetical protein LBH61_06110 [Dysgonamonadaceae bacterium]|jgi:hypothetical protein|nr:hypothetical protein [Dysgonamonadaceae bacterium]